MRRHVLVLLTMAIAAAGAVVVGQQPPGTQTPTFGARTDLVQLDVSVLDRDRRPVRGLTADDFTILESGVVQAVSAFAEIDVPGSTPGKAVWVRDVGPDIVSNRPGTRRAVVIVMDDFHTRWGTAATRTAKDTAIAAVDQLGPADIAAVVYVVNRRLGQEFTVDRGRLRAAIDRFSPSAMGPQPDSRMSASAPGRGLTMPATNLRMPPGACMKDCVTQALRNAADIFHAWPGMRKTVILIGPGRYGDLDLVELAAEGDPIRDAIAAMQRANVTVHHFDPHGLEVEARRSVDFGLYSDSTGGRMIANTNAPQEMVPQVFAESSSYYLLGFEPVNAARDGRFRRIEVRVNRADVDVRARRGYYAPSDRSATPETPAAPAVEQALSGGLPTGDWPVSLTAVPFATRERPGAAVAVIARADIEADDAGDEIELVAVAFDDRWRQSATAKGRFVPPANRVLQVAEMGVRLDLAPGRYEVRVAVSSAGSSRTGSVYTSVTVPDFSRDRLSLSGLVLERNASGAALTDVLAGIVPARPTTERTFSMSDRVIAAMRVYQGGRRRIEPVHVDARVIADDDRVAFSESLTIEPAAFGDHRAADYRVALPLDRLAAGEYLLVIEGRAPSESARRDVRFAVREVEP